jgi:hypothetical protein
MSLNKPSLWGDLESLFLSLELEFSLGKGLNISEAVALLPEFPNEISSLVLGVWDEYLWYLSFFDDFGESGILLLLILLLLLLLILLLLLFLKLLSKTEDCLLSLSLIESVNICIFSCSNRDEFLLSWLLGDIVSEGESWAPCDFLYSNTLVYYYILIH